jgi:solute carrier family 31 (copper transporter), member 1
MEMDMDPGENHSMHGGHNIADHSMQHGGHSMKMFFHLDFQDTTVLFEGWHIETVGGMVGSCFAVFLLGLFFELLKSCRCFLLRREAAQLSQLRRNRCCSPRTLHVVEADAVRVKIPDASRNTLLSKVCKSGHFMQTLLHLLQFLVGYSLMLIFMTYSVWLCLAVTFGIGFGYFFFGWTSQSPAALQNEDCCHCSTLD